MKTFNTHDELVAAAPKDRPFQVWVDSNPYGDGGRQLLWGFLHKEYLSTHMFSQYNINGINYAWAVWGSIYKGTFTLVDPFEEIKYQKPEVLPVGTKVEILESARKCGDYKDWSDDKTSMQGKSATIVRAYDTTEGVFYEVSTGSFYCCFPHYCVRPVEEKERTVEDVLAGLSDEDKEILSKVMNK